MCCLYSCRIWRSVSGNAHKFKCNPVFCLVIILICWMIFGQIISAEFWNETKKHFFFSIWENLVLFLRNGKMLTFLFLFKLSHCIFEEPCFCLHKSGDITISTQHSPIFGKKKGWVVIGNFFLEDFLSKKVFLCFLPGKERVRGIFCFFLSE